MSDQAANNKAPALTRKTLTRTLHNKLYMDTVGMLFSISKWLLVLFSALVVLISALLGLVRAGARPC